MSGWIAYPGSHAIRQQIDAERQTLDLRPICPCGAWAVHRGLCDPCAERILDLANDHARGDLD